MCKYLHAVHACKSAEENDLSQILKSVIAPPGMEQSGSGALQLMRNTFWISSKGTVKSERRTSLSKLILDINSPFCKYLYWNNCISTPTHSFLRISDFFISKFLKISSIFDINDPKLIWNFYEIFIYSVHYTSWKLKLELWEN